MSESIAVIGAGAWGTALSIEFAKQDHHVDLWCFEDGLIKTMREKRVNTVYLPKVKIPENVKITNSLRETVLEKKIIFSVVPSQYLRNVTSSYSPYVKDPIIISCTKGFEQETCLRMSQLAKEVIPNAKAFALSGPTFARDVAVGNPAAAVIAGDAEAEDELVRMQTLFSSGNFRLYTSNDIIGVEMGGALKNVIAIAAGICSGLRLGHSARSTLITRGLVEITKLAVACGANPETITGLSGSGDMWMTATSPQSRNFKCGLRVGQGERLSVILATTNKVVEGVNTIKTTLNLAKEHNINMPITEQLAKILFENKSPREAVNELMRRGLREE